MAEEMGTGDIFAHPDIDIDRAQVRLENILQQRAPA
jgi:hypothetical protein